MRSLTLIVELPQELVPGVGRRLRMVAGLTLGLLFLTAPMNDLAASSLSPVRIAALAVGFTTAAAAGHDTAADIAAALHLSEGTVRNYLSAAIRKLGAPNRREAIDLAVEKGWL